MVWPPLKLGLFICCCCLACRALILSRALARAAELSCCLILARISYSCIRDVARATSSSPCITEYSQRESEPNVAKVYTRTHIKSSNWCGRPWCALLRRGSREGRCLHAATELVDLGGCDRTRDQLGSRSNALVVRTRLFGWII